MQVYNERIFEIISFILCYYIVEPCYNLRRECESMAKRGMCEKRELMMRSSCGLSCGFCSEMREFDGNLLGHFHV